MLRITVLLLLAARLPGQPEAAPPYPAGSSSQEFEGMRFQLAVPDDIEAGNPPSLIVILHGAGGTETGMAHALQPLTEQHFVVCAPKSAGATWQTGDLATVRSLIRHLLDVYEVPPGRLHGAGFSNGGWNLGPLVMDDAFAFASACWIAAGFTGGKVPKRARQGMGALALAGDQDPNRGAAEKTVDLLRKKVRSVEVRLQAGLGHEFPDELMPYYFYWLGVMEGRYTPGLDLSFDWLSDPEEARSRMEEGQRAGFIYFHAPEDADEPEGKALQHVVFLDPLVRHFGSQLVAVKLERQAHEELFASFKLKATPAVVLVRPDLSRLKSFSGRIRPGVLGKALRAVAPDRTMPE